MMTEMTAVGGVLLLGIAISSMLEIKPIRVGISCLPRHRPAGCGNPDIPWR